MRDRLTNRLLIFMAGIGLIVHCLLLVRYTVDDAFISYRYARNWVDGHGLVFNPGERVEGYTNFLWTIVHALGLRGGLDPEVLSKVLGIAAAVGTMVLIAALGRAWGHGRVPMAALGCIFWASAGAVAITAVNGLETQMFAVLVTLGVFLYATAENRSRRLMGAVAAVSVSTLVRPDGALLLLVTLAHYYLGQRRRASLAPLALALLMTCPHLVWRFFYYGSFVPNTLGAKTGGGLPQLVRGVEYLKNFVNEYGKPALYLIAALPFLHWPLDRARSHGLAIVLAFCAYVAAAGGDWIPHYRFLIPIMPLLMVALQDGVLSIRSLLPRSGRFGFVPSAVIWGFMGVIVFDIANQTHYLRLHTDMWADGYHHAHQRIGAWLRDNAQPEDTVALMDIGIIGYSSNIRVVDITGLTDPHVAAAPGGWLKKSYSPDYLFDIDPEFFVLVSAADYPKEAFGSSFPIDRAVFEDERFLQRYRFLFSADAYVSRRPHISGYYLLLFRRKA
ncbi:hypothetical protein JXA88_13365 [Candidatus Fermentibacteria bacterium]|nr:hypothetical protein [Candidatus Fermentibacteria bacterium]